MTDISHDELTGYLLRKGWRRGSPGDYGSLWALGDNEPVGITHRLDSTSPDWQGTLERLGLAMRLDAKSVERQLLHAYVDEISFKVPTSDDSIPLSVGVALFAMAQKAVRASATSAQRPRPVVDNVPKGAKRIVEQVSVGHTRSGSYVVPIRYVLDRVLTEPARSAENLHQEPLDGDWEANRESTQRRASRTLMQALGVLNSEVVQPDKPPTPDTVRMLIPAGVTRELVTAVRSMVVTEEVAQVGATATWASAVREPARTPDRVVVDRDAAEVLKITAEKLGALKPPRGGEVVAGPLVHLHTSDVKRNRAEGVAATVGIQVIRHGRQATVFVDTEPELWGEVNGWLESGEVVTAYGVVRRGPRGLVLTRQGAIASLAQGVLPM